MTLQKEHNNTEIQIFLITDFVNCALSNQITIQDYYNIERMLKLVINKNGQVKVCEIYAEACGIKKLTFIDSIEMSTMSQLAQWTVESDKIFSF